MAEELHYRIIQGLAEAEGTGPEDLESCLYEYTDIDALTKLYQQGCVNPTVTLEIRDHEVTVTDEGDVRVDGKLRTLSCGG
ncbi:hypothetical protein C475_01147 [Halosimplex carlsbadense 2-9-1]|uniref:Halobacterial output domain-containing protein n=1 Tax=Halosimplex carlsbadense 2-9-1 TaxID=797114 RepID=M0D613_9EURY|nr:HalOD1 output domain-containing protein [Halosimplex carlsbadense]ELZ30298.1 hypothetical protein C475_01147 [Halosimplex carlsbadense 2-9-1]